MKHRPLIQALILSIALFSSFVLNAQDRGTKPEPAGAATPEGAPESVEVGMGQVAEGDEAAPETPAQRARRIATPAENHESLEALIGEWDTTIRIWNSPMGEPVETQGTAESRWILEGRFVETTYRGEVLGQQIEARVVEGYDNLEREFVTTWRDTMGTYTLIFRGNCSMECTIWTKTAEIVDPISNTKIKNRAITTSVDDDNYTYESFLLIDGSDREFKNMELLAERREGSPRRKRTEEVSDPDGETALDEKEDSPDQGRR